MQQIWYNRRNHHGYAQCRLPRDAGGEKLLVEYCIRVTAGWQIVDVLQPFARRAAVVLEKSAFTAGIIPLHWHPAFVRRWLRVP